MGIKSILPAQVLDSRGEPTLKVKMTAENGTSAWFVVPSGASTGAGEAQKKLDEGESYGGKSITACIDLINNIVAPKFIGYPIEHQDDFDSLLIALDGSENKENLGANTILALSGAYFKLGAKLSKKPLWQYIAESRGTSPEFPRIYANMVGGGKHAPGLDIQEFMIIPKSNQPIEAVELISQVYSTLKNIMVSLYGPAAKLVGDEGALAPVGARTEVVLEAFSNLNAKMEGQFEIALDVAANSFFDGKAYQFEGQSIHASDLLAIYEDWNNKFDIYSIEDPFAEADLEGLELLKTIPKDKKPFLIVADDYTVTNAAKINEFAQEQVFDGVIIKPDQVGSITEMFAAIDAARQAGNEIIVSHRSGESNDDFIVDLAYGVGAFGIKIGAPCRGERIAKYNRLLEIEYAQDALQAKNGPVDNTIKPIETPLDRPAGKPSPAPSGTTPATPPNPATSPLPAQPGSMRDIHFGGPNQAQPSLASSLNSNSANPQPAGPKPAPASSTHERSPLSPAQTAETTKPNAPAAPPVPPTPPSPLSSSIPTPPSNPAPAIGQPGAMPASSAPPAQTGTSFQSGTQALNPTLRASSPDTGHCEDLGTGVPPLAPL